MVGYATLRQLRMQNSELKNSISGDNFLLFNNFKTHVRLVTC